MVFAGIVLKMYLQSYHPVNNILVDCCQQGLLGFLSLSERV